MSPLNFWKREVCWKVASRGEGRKEGRSHWSILDGSRSLGRRHVPVSMQQLHWCDRTSMTTSHANMTHSPAQLSVSVCVSIGSWPVSFLNVSLIFCEGLQQELLMCADVYFKLYYVILCSRPQYSSHQPKEDTSTSPCLGELSIARNFLWLATLILTLSHLCEYSQSLYNY